MKEPFDETTGESDALAPGRFSYDGLDRVIHEKARLGILTSLATHPDGLVFGDLKELCSLTDGNLSRHLQVLAEAGLVVIHKTYKDKRPSTQVVLTPEGRTRFLNYIAALEIVVTDALAGNRAEGNELRKGWRLA